ncbi:uncharacterized protein LOC131971901 isoform X2 [Centropristis striata]|uniref:uncharacterized protein LOC131971901 isoform X2 n=1 Tax=Centropristis striata TaxID=184440 RepID=UPI0027E12011|nr:uncharacterized protein LOC131971901 isoform X2 [Centropristis striata]
MDRSREGPSLKEMELNVAANVVMGSCGRPNSYELLTWLNKTLQTGFTKMEQVCTGAAYCQLMHWLFPTSLDLSKVRFQSNDVVDAIHNYSLLQAAFSKVGVVRHIPIEALMKRNSIVTLTFLGWFKVFCDKNKTMDRQYDALHARGGQSMGPATSDGHSTQNPPQKPESIVKAGGKNVEEPSKEKVTESLNKATEAVVVLSDDDDDVIIVTVEQNTENIETSVEQNCEKMDINLKEEETEAKQKPLKMELNSKEEEEIKAKRAEAAVENDGSHKSLLHFIRRHCWNQTDHSVWFTSDSQVSASLGPTHPADLVEACSQWPYCLYLYVGVEMGGGQNNSIVLIGYFNPSSGVSVLKPLLTLHTSVTAADTQTSADSDSDSITDASAAETDARLLIQSLQRCGLTLSKVSVFYCNAPHPAVSRPFVSEMQTFNPRLVSLCGLPGIASRACQAGLLTAFSGVVDLITDLHYQYYTRSSVRETLRDLFAGTESFNPSRPISAQCLFIINAVQKMATRWRVLLEYYRSLMHTEDVDLIRTRLMDQKLKLRFIFLSDILRPLQALQELQQEASGCVADELHHTATLVQSYATSVLRLSGAERFLRKRDPQLLQDDIALLPVTEVNIGAHAREFLWATAVVDLGEQERKDFQKDAATFYKAALVSLAESLPEHLGDSALRNINQVVKNGHITGNSLTMKTLSEFGVQLGLVNAGTLTCNYRIFIKTLKEQQTSCWRKILKDARPNSALQELLLTLLALPRSLNRTVLFAKMSIEPPPTSKKPHEAPPQPKRRTGRPRVRKRRSVAAGCDDKNRSESSSEDDVKPPLQLLPNHHHSMDDSDYTDNSSDVVDVTEDFKMSRTRRLVKASSERTPPTKSPFIRGCDEDDDDDDEEECVIVTKNPTNSAELLGVTGELVWGQMDSSSIWPAIIVPSKGEKQPPETTRVEWYGQNMTSQVSLQDLKPFAAFAQHFSHNYFTILVSYRVAVFLALQEAAQRCRKHFSASYESRDEVLKQMLDWALCGFQPTGPDGLRSAAVNGIAGKNKRPKVKQRLFQKANSTPTTTKNISVETKDVSVTLNKFSPQGGGGRAEKGSRGGWEAEREDSASPGWEKVRGGGRGRGRGGKVQRKKISPLDGFDDDISPDFLPYKKNIYSKMYNKVIEASGSYTQPDQKLREETIRRIMDMKLDIEGFCLCCGTEDVEIFHPLFKGSLCRKCKNNLTETLYRYDEDGYQSYCTICCYGMEVILCGKDSCFRSYCADCLDILISPGSFESLKQLDPWICYLCQPLQTHGALTPREDWSIRVQELFANNSAMAFEPHRVYPSIPANLRRPLRVLSLFDGIATGYVVLKDLGFKVEKYVASEVCEDSLAVATINHDKKIIHVGDVRSITQDNLEQWGPFDLLIGGSPCNDLSIVNPVRKGLFEGTGRLFFDFYRILQLLKPREEDPRPFFWLFENVTFMNTHDKVNICRFLECNPVQLNAVRVSPAHRARYFWGNIPGMSRPIIASQNDKLNLQDCLEIGREARVTKVRTITTNPNSLKQGKGLTSLLPVLQDGKEDNLWITELEKIFGFPKHYTDVRNMNRQQRQKVLGKAWSVPVIRHLFAPLKDYFACEELPALTTTTSSSTSTSPSSLASPELQQLR